MYTICSSGSPRPLIWALLEVGMSKAVTGECLVVIPVFSLQPGSRRSSRPQSSSLRPSTMATLRPMRESPGGLGWGVMEGEDGGWGPSSLGFGPQENL